jgi:hypothetical protein
MPHVVCWSDASEQKADLDAIERMLGSVAFKNFVRSVVILREEPDKLVRLVHAKHNLSDRGEDLLFSKHNTQPKDHPRGQYLRLDWEKADENIDKATALGEILGKKQKEDVGAAKWLLDYLDDGKWHLCSKMVKEGDRRGMTYDLLKKTRLRINKKGEIRIETSATTGGANASWRITSAPEAV